MVMSSKQLDKNLEAKREIWVNDIGLGTNSIQKIIWPLAIVLKVGSPRKQKVIVVALEYKMAQGQRTLALLCADWESLSVVT